MSEASDRREIATVKTVTAQGERLPRSRPRPRQPLCRVVGAVTLRDLTIFLPTLTVTQRLAL
jgi:hypothetical protein